MKLDHVQVEELDDSEFYYVDEFDVINDNMSKINNVKGLENVEPLHFPQDLMVKEIRDGRTSRMIDIEDALKNCDDYIDREVEIIRVVK